MKDGRKHFPTKSKLNIYVSYLSVNTLINIVNARKSNCNKNNISDHIEQYWIRIPTHVLT